MLTPTLTGALVRLEPLTEAHARDLAAAASGDRSTYGFTVVPASLPEASAYVAARLAAAASGAEMPFAVVRRADERVVGATRYLDMATFADRGGRLTAVPPTDEEPPTVVEVGGTWYAAEAQRTGVNRDAKRLLLGHAFDVWGCRRVSFKTDARNERSRRAIEALGARFEGVRRIHAPAADGTLRSSAYYSITADEWPEVRDRLAAPRA